MTKNKGGRPSKYGTINLKKVGLLAGYGLTQAEIADYLDISGKTLSNYKTKDKFLQAIKKGKHKADSAVTQRLYKRAMGYKYEEVHLEQMSLKGKIVKGLFKRKTITKEVAPEVVAQIYWLKNRRPDLWREGYSGQSEKLPEIKIFVQNIINKAGVDESKEKTNPSHREIKAQFN